MDATEALSPNSPDSSISLVLPAFNEQEVIAQAIAEADEALAEITNDYEVIVVDDGSSDRTAEITAQECTKRPNVRLLQQPTNQGYGAALARGFRESTKSLVAFTDSDCHFLIAGSKSASYRYRRKGRYAANRYCIKLMT